MFPLMPDATQTGQLVALVSVGKDDELVAIITQYLLAPFTADQLSDGVTETPAAPSEGPLRVGAGSKVTTGAVVKLRMLE